MRSLGLRRLLPRHQQGPAPAMVQHEWLRKSRKATAMAMRDAIETKRYRSRTAAGGGIGSPGSSTSAAGLSIASTTSMPRWLQMLARPAGNGASVTKVWIWLRWAMGTGALRRSFVGSATGMVPRAFEVGVRGVVT